MASEWDPQLRGPPGHSRGQQLVQWPRARKSSAAQTQASGCGNSRTGKKRINKGSRVRKDKQHRKRVRRKDKQHRKRTRRKWAYINGYLTELATRTIVEGLQKVLKVEGLKLRARCEWKRRHAREEAHPTTTVAASESATVAATTT
ncbi:hypothetical protein AAVH_24671 [Aphelenchoides avenae]|nr:hypothetical protein AAVH_24671 [Aphelenchus avenae]